MRPEEDIPLDAADTPKVLALEVRAGAPTIDFQGQDVFPVLQIGIDAEDSRVLGVFVVSHFLAIQINVQTRLGAADIEVNIAVFPVRRHFNVATINTDRVFLGQKRRSRVAGLELVAVIGINRRPETLAFPVSRHLDILPRRGAHRRVCDVRRKLLVAIDEVEFPRPVEREIIGAVLVAHRQGRFAVGIAHEIRTGSFPVHRDRLHILPIGQCACRLCLRFKSRAYRNGQ